MADLLGLFGAAVVAGGAFAAGTSGNCDWGRSKAPTQDSCTTFSLMVENDTFFNGGDRYYTQGLQLRWTSPEVFEEKDSPAWTAIKSRLVPWDFAGMGSDRRRRVHFGLGQNIYTPANINERRPIPQDRPYAGWSYASIGGTSQDPIGGGFERLDVYEADVGIVGPGAAAKWSQTEYHRGLGINLPQGWGNQIDNEIGIVVFRERHWRTPELVPGRNEDDPKLLDVAPRLGVALGNVFTYAAAGATLRLGYNLPDDFGPTGIRPGLPGGGFSAPPREGFALYAFAGGEQRAVLRNMFLDGGVIGSDPRVEKKPLVHDLYAGFAFQYATLKVTVAEVMRSPEFDGQTKRHQFGAISLSFRY